MNEIHLPAYTIQTFQGNSLKQNYNDILPDLMRLRLSVFYEYPYLYVGNEDEERRYSERYLNIPGAVVVLVRDAKGHIVGASTGAPLRHELDCFQEPFLTKNRPIESVYYFAESMLMPEHRGHGLYKYFFQEREKAARLANCNQTVFISVNRPPNHPLCPENYQDVKIMWPHYGYEQDPDLHLTFSYLEREENEPSPKTFSFWVKNLDNK